MTDERLLAEIDAIRPEAAALGVAVEVTDLGSILTWQDRPRSETGGELQGDTPETLLPYIVKRLYDLHARQPSADTLAAAEHCQAALEALRARRADRDARGVTGVDVP